MQAAGRKWAGKSTRKDAEACEQAEAAIAVREEQAKAAAEAPIAAARVVTPEAEAGRDVEGTSVSPLQPLRDPITPKVTGPTGDHSGMAQVARQQFVQPVEPIDLSAEAAARNKSSAMATLIKIHRPQDQYGGTGDIFQLCLNAFNKSCDRANVKPDDRLGALDMMLKSPAKEWPRVKTLKTAVLGV